MDVDKKMSASTLRETLNLARAGGDNLGRPLLARMVQEFPRPGWTAWFSWLPWFSASGLSKEQGAACCDVLKAFRSLAADQNHKKLCTKGQGFCMEKKVSGNCGIAKAKKRSSCLEMPNPA